MHGGMSKSAPVASGGTSLAGSRPAYPVGPSPCSRSIRYLMAMENVLAALIGALAVLGGVGAGAWFQGRREHERWLRGEKLAPR